MDAGGAVVAGVDAGAGADGELAAFEVTEKFPAPGACTLPASPPTPAAVTDLRAHRIRRQPVLDGLINEYRHAA